MKKTLYISAMALTLTVGQAVLAQEEGKKGFREAFTDFFEPDWEKDFSVTVGVKIWVNEWTRDVFPTRLAIADDVIDELGGSGTITAVFSNRAPQTQTSDIEPIPIPQLSARYKWLLLSGSYYPETGFEYRTTATDATITQEQNFLGVGRRTTQVTIFDTTRAEREEWDAALGILIHPNVAILGGYKEINQEVRDVFTADRVVDGVMDVTGQPAGTSSSELKIQGPTIGIAGSLPIARGFGIYASYAHGFMDVDLKDIADGTISLGDRDAEYDVAELGFSYTRGTKGFIPFAPLSAATVYAGYRWQHIETDFEDDPNREDRTDTTRGFAVGVNLTF
jgi:hypothetical protein